MERLQSILRMRSQSQGDDYEFCSKLVFTRGFLAEFGVEAIPLAMQALYMIHSRLVNSAVGADSFQRFLYQDSSFLIIDDIDHVTFLLPNEY